MKSLQLFIRFALAGVLGSAFLFFGIRVEAQGKDAGRDKDKTVLVNGKVTNFEESFPLEGVSIVVKGTRNTTGTQADGTFTLSVRPEDKTLIISFPGYESLEVMLSLEKNSYDIVLKRKE